MKKIFTVLFMLLVVNAMGAGKQAICEKDSGWWYPKNEIAKKITGYLKVKTCGGKRFHKFIKENGLTTNAKIRGKGKKDVAAFIKSL